MSGYSDKARRAMNFVDFRRDGKDEIFHFEDRGPVVSVIDLDAKAVENDKSRKVLWTGSYLQGSAANIPRGGEIPLESYPDGDIMMLVVRGEGVLESGKDSFLISSGYGIFVGSGKNYSIKNTGRWDMKLICVSAPPRYGRGSEKL